MFTIGRISPRALPILQRSPRKFFYAYIYCQSATFGPLAFCVYSLFFTMFTSDLNAGIVPQMSSPPHDLERLRTTTVDFIVLSIKLVFMVLGVSYSRVLAQRPMGCWSACPANTQHSSPKPHFHRRYLTFISHLQSPSFCSRAP